MVAKRLSVSVFYRDQRDLAGRHLYSLCRKSFGVTALEFQTQCRGARGQGGRSIHELWQAVKNHSFNADVIVEVFKVFERRYRAGYVRVQRRRSVSRKRDVMRLAERGDLQKSCTPPQRVMSACCTSTAPAESMLRK